MMFSLFFFFGGGEEGVGEGSDLCPIKVFTGHIRHVSTI